MFLKPAFRHEYNNKLAEFRTAFRCDHQLTNREVGCALRGVGTSSLLILCMRRTKIHMPAAYRACDVQSVHLVMSGTQAKSK